MKFSVDKNERYVVLRLQEQNLNSLMAPTLKSEFIFFANEGVQNLILDVQDVQYVDSSGLSAILTANRLFKGEGSFVLTGVAHPNLKKLIEISRVDTVLTIIPTVSEAIEYILMEELERDLQDAEED